MSHVRSEHVERFVAAGNLSSQPRPYGKVTSLCGPDMTESRHVRLSRVLISADRRYEFHCHPELEETLFVLRGTAQHWIEQSKRLLQPGDVAVMPPGVPHATICHGEGELEFLSIFSPVHCTGPAEVDLSGEEPWKSLLLEQCYRYLDIRTEGDVAVARVTQKTISHSPTIDGIQAEILRLMHTGTHRKLLLNFRDIEFLSSTFLGTLIKLQSEITRSGGQLRICEVRPDIQEVFRVTRLTDLFGMDETESAGLATLGLETTV